MRVRCLAFALALTLAFSAGAANADVVLTFNDLTETPSVTISGGSANIVQIAPEDFVVILPTGTLPAPVALNVAYVLTDPGTSTISDIVYFNALANTGLLVEFQSDTEGVPLVVAPGFTVYGTAAETGAAQSIPLPPGLSTVSGLSVFVASDIEAVPEPSILALAGTGGLLGLGLWGYRRRKA
jgi:hypothetical protein